jgi:hypothetical protein
LGTALLAKAATLTCFDDLITEESAGWPPQHVKFCEARCAAAVQRLALPCESAGACAADRASLHQGAPWRWGLFSHGCVFCIVDYVCLQAFLGAAEPSASPEAAPAAETLETKLLTPSNSHESLLSEASSHAGAKDEADEEQEGEEGGADAGLRTKLSKLSAKRAVLWRLLVLALPEWPYLAGGFTFLLAAAGTTTWLPKLTGEVIDDVVIEKDPDAVAASLSRLTLVSLASAVASGLRGTCFLIIMVKMNVRLRDRVRSPRPAPRASAREAPVPTACGGIVRRCTRRSCGRRWTFSTRPRQETSRAG